MLTFGQGNRTGTTPRIRAFQCEKPSHSTLGIVNYGAIGQTRMPGPTPYLFGVESLCVGRCVKSLVPDTDKNKN